MIVDNPRCCHLFRVKVSYFLSFLLLFVSAVINPNQASTSTGITSNLDPEVLQNLPPDIQREVLENERAQRAKAETVVQNLGPVEELPSFSQVCSKSFLHILSF